MIKNRLNVTHDIPATRQAVRELRSSGLKIGFVPTMGALHEGHLALIRRAKELADAVIVSIFVNPTQFEPSEDFAKYPRPLQKDLDLCEEYGVDLVFQPDAGEMYLGGDLIQIKAGEMARYLCGRSRPGHFDGVLQIVNKLFNIIGPDISVFGQKDIQQLFIIRQMISDFKMDMKIVMIPTQRDPDGLAISSRNIYLSETERKLAPLLFHTLSNIAIQIKNGEFNIESLIKFHSDEVGKKGLKIDYISCVEPPKLHPVSQIQKGKNYILAGAVFAGHTRLIDNLIIDV